ncbi:MAG: T9SS type A sorting domain-containing protein [Saprospiraceae bacterium]
MPHDGCYQLRVFDDYADGMCCLYGNGFYRLRIPGGSPILSGGAFGALEEQYFSVTTPITPTVNTATPASAASITPNPVPSGVPLSILWNGTPPDTYRWKVLSTDGRCIVEGMDDTIIERNELPAGYYILQLNYNERLQSLPFISY